MENGRFPTLDEVRVAVELKSVSTVHTHVKGLLEDGILEADEFGGYRLVEDSDVASRDVPIVGRITAGLPIEAIEDAVACVKVPNLPKNQDFFALEVVGDSMMDEGILDGDVVVIKRQTSAENGQTVVAIVDGDQATLKKLFRDKKGFRLQPANQSMLPIYRKEIEVRGIVWKVIRDYAVATSPRAEVVPTQEWKTLDLFAGVGGIRLGFEKAGFSTVFANDFEPKCADTYNKNFNAPKLTVEDITQIPDEDIPDCDFVLGGFPCQAFSVAGYRHGFDDELGRGNLFFDVARIIKAKQPSGFLLENVKNLRTHDNGKTYRIIEETLQDLGYFVKARVLNSMAYGNVPQNRERIYIVGFQDPDKTEQFEFPEPVPLKRTMQDMLDIEVEEKYYYDNKPLYDHLKNEVIEENEVYQWRRQYVRKNKKGVCPTLTANMGMGGHNVPIIFDGKGIRKLTPRECFRVQGFPEDYKLPDIADSSLYKQAGNSVTVTVIARLAEQMLRVI